MAVELILAPKTRRTSQSGMARNRGCRHALEGVGDHGPTRLHGDLTLPENAKAYVVVPSLDDSDTLDLRSPRLANRKDAAYFVKEALEIPEDADLSYLGIHAEQNIKELARCASPD